MTIASGTRLGPYELVAAPGACGMADVWRARDARLQRDMAIRVLQAGVAGDTGRHRATRAVRASRACVAPPAALSRVA